MQFQNQEVNLMNFREVFHDASPELLDEVVTSIIYDVEIGPFIERWGDNPNLIKQIKWGILEKLPIKYFKLGNDKVIQALREAHKSGLVLDSNQFEILMVLDWEVALVYISWLRDGIPLEGYSVRSVNLETAKVVTPFLLEGRDMMRYFNGRKYSPVGVRCIENIRDKGLNWEHLLRVGYSDEVLMFLATKVGNEVLNKTISHITPKTKLATVKALYEVFLLGLYPENLIQSLDQINPKRLNTLAEAYRNGVEWRLFDDVGVPVRHLSSKLKTQIELNKSKKLVL